MRRTGLLVVLLAALASGGGGRPAGFYCEPPDPLGCVLCCDDGGQDCFYCCPDRRGGWECD